MALIRAHRLLMLVVVLLYAAGHTHQVFGRFAVHHHCADLADRDNDGSEQDHDDDHREKDAEHMLEHHALAAVVPLLIMPVIVTMHSVALVDLSAEMMPEAPVAGIDHPPQLVG